MKERIIRFGLPALAVATSIGIGFAGVTSAQTAPPGAQSTQHRPLGAGERPAVIGSISSISGTTITVVSKGPRNGSLGTTASYTVDVSSAKILKAAAGAAPVESSVSALSVGDMVAVQGTISGTTVTATEVVDGVRFGAGHGRGPGQGMDEGAIGTVTAINGSTITLTNKGGKVYTVDASAAKIGKIQTIQLGDIKVGDTLGVRGSMSGTSISAKEIMDGIPPGPARQ